MALRRLPQLLRSAAAVARQPSLRAMSTSHMIDFPGAKAPLMHKLHITAYEEHSPIPCYRILGPDGTFINQDDAPELPDEELVRWYKLMVTLSQMDHILYESQRQGRISFYMTNYGEEATHIGTAAGLNSDDVIYAQYREAGVLLYRGFTLQQFMDQCYSNIGDMGKGRQMPVHYGSSELNFHTISSPLGTQIPQASGAAYAVKRAHEDRVVACYFGDGAASEGDAHAAFNFAATLDCPIVFICRNNGYAISTPTKEQYRGDGIAGRAAGYGMDCIRVDGNDVFAVYNATKAARETALKKQRPVLVESMCYRIGHHSTSDDSSAYRETNEVSVFSQDTGISRLQTYLRNQGLWDDEKDVEFIKSIKAEIRKEFTAAEKRPKPPLHEMFMDVYDKPPARLLKQEQQMHEMIKKYPNEYPTKRHQSSS